MNRDIRELMEASLPPNYQANLEAMAAEDARKVEAMAAEDSRRLDAIFNEVNDGEEKSLAGLAARLHAFFVSSRR